MAKRRRKSTRRRSTSCTKAKGGWKMCSPGKKKLGPKECRRVKGGNIICNEGTASKPQIRFKKVSSVLGSR